MIETLGYFFLAYLFVGICVSIYGVYERNKQNKKQGFRLETYKEIIIVSIIGILIRPFILFTEY